MKEIVHNNYNLLNSRSLYSTSKLDYIYKQSLLLGSMKLRMKQNEKTKCLGKKKKHTTVGIRWSSPTQLLIHRFGAYVWQSGRDAQFSPIYGRMC
jgi:hypothetical protein